MSLNRAHLDIDLDATTVEVMGDMPSISIGVPGLPGPAGPDEVVTWPTGSEPSLVGVPDGTLWIEYQP